MSILGMACAGISWTSAGQEPIPPPPKAPSAGQAPAEPPAQEPLPETTAEPAEEVVGPTPGAPTMSLAQAVEKALVGNYSLLAAADSLQSSRVQESSSLAQFFPNLIPRYQRSEDSSSLFLDASQRLPWSGGTVTASGSVQSTPASDVAPTRSSSLRVILTQPLLRGFGPNATYFSLRNSRRNRLAQERSFELGRQRLAVQVTRTFYEVIQQRQLLAVARQSFKRSDDLMRASEARLRVGLVSKLDVYRAELQASQARDSMVRSQAALESAQEEFRSVLGLSPVDPVEPEAALLPNQIDSDVEPLEVLVARAIENRLDLHETRDQIGDARRTASLARQNLFPQLDLNVGFNKAGFGPSFSQAFRSGDGRFDVFLSTSYPLERSSERASHSLAKLDLEARSRNLRQKEIEVEAEVRSSVRNLERIRKSVELQSKAVEIAQAQRRLATLRYQRGLASNFDVVDAESSLVLTRSALVGLLTSYRVARVDLLRVTGTLDVDREFTR